METRMELFARIRRDARVEGCSIRQLARRHQVGRATVRMALAQAEPPPRKVPVRCSPKLDPFKAAIDAMLTADIDAPRKQRHTARRILARLADEHGAQHLSYSTVRDYVRVRRAQIDVEAGRRIEVFVPQEHAPGAEAEVDFGEVWVILAGVKTKCHMFAFRLSHSGKAVHRVYSTQGQEAFLEGHIAAFEEIGGVPTRHIRYDNLTSAVQKVIYGSSRARVENQRWVLFRSHFGFDPFYCQPGISGAHEKGGVEGEVGRFRRNRLSPMPVVNSLDELNEKIRAWDTADNGRRINDRIRTVGQDFAVEAPLLLPVPSEGFDPGLSLEPRVDRSALITVRMAKYSVPARFIGRQVRVSLRGVGSGGLRRPGGDRSPSTGHRPGRSEPRSRPLPRSVAHQTRRPARASALAAARRNGTFTSSHDAFWAAARKTDGDAGGTRQLIDVLLLHRTIDSDDVIAGIEAALTVGAVTADVVAVEARRHASLEVDAGGSDSGRHLVARRSGREQRVVSLTQRRLADPAAVIAGLPADSRPAPTVDHYDQLLRLPERRNPAQPAARAE